ncbi:MAG: trypsin-like peptidase domain-containing protein [Terriglobia bacterium]
MGDIETVIPLVRQSVAAILRLHLARPESVKRGKVRPARYEAKVAGTAFCVVADRYLLTAHHILNDEKQRDPGDKFYAFVVPENGNLAYHFPIISFPIERTDCDMALLEVGPCATAGTRLPAIPVSFANHADGSRVVTLGFPAPEIAGLNLDQGGNFRAGNFFLKSHANEGIVSAQYVIEGVLFYELNVGWHHGESGGPIVAVGDPVAAFALMQHYRPIKSPFGTVAGPHRGRTLALIQQELTALGVTNV